MAIPIYDTDLTDIDLAEIVTGYVQINVLGGGGGTLGVGADFSMQGSNCVDRQVTSNHRGIAFDNGSAVIADGTAGDDHIWVWSFVATAGLTDLIANAGHSVIIGSTTANYTQYHVEGSDTYGASGRVARCYPIRVNNTTNASPPYRTNQGSPTTAVRIAGSTINITGTVKGANLGLDAQRYGTGMFINSGDITNPATFSGSSAKNDLVANRWGVLTKVGGAFELQGYFGIGQATGSVATQVYWDESDSFIQFVDTIHSDPDFTKIIIDHPQTVCNFTNNTFLALGSHNPGLLTVNDASTTASFDTCTFSGMGKTRFNANVTASNCTWRNSDVVYHSGSHIDGCTFAHILSAGSASLVTATLNSISNCTFLTGSGVANGGHGIELTIGGVTASFVGNLFTNFAANDTSGSAIFNNSGNNLVINVSGQGDTPTIRNGSGATTQINNPTTLTVTNIVSGSEIRIHQDDGPPRTELAGQESVEGSFAYNYNYGGDIDALIVVGHEEYVWEEIAITLTNDNKTQAMQQRLDRNYSNPP